MIDFTKIRWAEEDCILITRREDRQTLFLLTSNEIKELLKEWNNLPANRKGCGQETIFEIDGTRGIIRRKYSCGKTRFGKPVLCPSCKARQWSIILKEAEQNKMVLTDGFTGKYLNGDSCKEGQTCVISGEGAYSERDYEGRKSKQLDLPVSLEGKEMIYTPKMSEGRKLVEAFGADTINWVGKRFVCHIVKTKLYGQVKSLLEIEPIIDQKI